MPLRVHVDPNAIAAFCRRHGIRRFAIFGSATRGDFRPDSDVDVLVDFRPDSIPTLFDLVRMEDELSPLFGGRRVDLRTPEDLNRRWRDEAVARAEVQFAEG